MGVCMKKNSSALCFMLYAIRKKSVIKEMVQDDLIKAYLKI